MAAYAEPEIVETRECANCSSQECLSLCTRCRSAYFCSLKCQRAYWPFHKAWCRQNDFADALEKTEPKFAAWMRKHGKVAVLKDDEVDRIERKVASVEDMYGRADPKPAPPSYDADDLRAMRAAEEQAASAARANRTERLWTSVLVPEHLGIECERYKWRQNQSYVEVFVLLPPGLDPKAVVVQLTPSTLRVCMGENVIVDGELYAPIKAEESVWLITDGLLEIQMLKRNRRGQYANGCTNADTFWFALLADARNKQRLVLAAPPAAYYKSDWEKIGVLNATKMAARRGYAAGAGTGRVALIG